jgi:addiction module HigA family antidote
MKKTEISLLSKPGDTIQETIDGIGMSQRELAERLGYSPSKLNMLVKGEMSLTRDMAAKLENVLNIPSAFWLKLEQQYQEQKLKQEKELRLRANMDRLSGFPIRKLRNLGIIKSVRKSPEQLMELLQFFRIASLDEWERIYRDEEISVAFKLSLVQTQNAESLSSWLRYGEVQADELNLLSYNSSKFKRALKEAKDLSFEDTSNFNRLQDLCAKCGVAVVFTPSFPNAPVYGSTRWIKGRQHPLIQISDRGKRTDFCWFSFFHEAGHVLKHGKTDIFLEGVDGVEQDPIKEQEANEFARQFLLGGFSFDQYLGFEDLVWEEIVDEVSSKYRIHPGILVGQLQRMKLIDFSELNELRVKVEF